MINAVREAVRQVASVLIARGKYGRPFDHLEITTLRKVVITATSYVTLRPTGGDYGSASDLRLDAFPGIRLLLRRSGNHAALTGGTANAGSARARSTRCSATRGAAD